MATVTRDEAMMALAHLEKNHQRLKFVSSCLRVTMTNKWLVQVIDAEGRYFTAYFDVPPAGTPEVLHADREAAFYAAIDEAMSHAGVAAC